MEVNANENTGKKSYIGNETQAYKLIRLENFKNEEKILLLNDRSNYKFLSTSTLCFS